jgi:hypothetical protein
MLESVKRRYATPHFVARFVLDLERPGYRQSSLREEFEIARKYMPVVMSVVDATGSPENGSLSPVSNN